jgi:2-polyprenyl-3-methyl-5-hydroxy-6-metoxy-1,4-benzoquinol methylase
MNDQQRLAANQALWDSRVAAHAASPFYDVEGFLAGACTLKPTEVAALGDVSGKSLLHLQCHFGLDTLSWARRGAKATGIDFSGEAIAKARELTLQAGLEATFVQSSVQDLPKHLQGTFDIVFTSYGIISWLPDLREWAKTVCHFLKPGGTFCIVEVHPALYMLDWYSLQIAYPYFGTGEAFLEEVQGSYASSETGKALPEYFWSHSLAEVIQPLLEGGLQMDLFQELPFSPWNCFPNLIETAPGQFEFPSLQGKLPMIFCLRMHKPG